MEAKKWVIVNEFDGYPKESDLEIQKEDLEPLKDGEFVCEAKVLSIDPYMRFVGNTAGSTMVGDQIANVIESKNPKFPVGDRVLISSGWRSRTVSDGSNARSLPSLGDLPSSLALGVLGMPGCTAYIALSEVVKLQKGEVLFVNGAAGAVGSVVGQLAKLKGCEVIGCASTQEKVDYLQELGFDHVFNHKETNIETALKKAAPKGIDVFFDNIGGTVTSTVFKHMKQRGRVLVCGTISGHNDKDGPGCNQIGPLPFHDILMKELRLSGFLFWNYPDLRQDAETFLLKLIKEGNLKYKEHEVNGFENMPAAFVDQLQGKRLGKVVVNV